MTTKRTARDRFGLTTEEYLKSRVNISSTGCWEWVGGRCEYGYGFANRYGKSFRSHRLSYETFVNKIPRGMLVLHRCDNPPCINPEHLFAGTHADNANDRDKKKRYGGTAAINRLKEKCNKGHLLSGENLVPSTKNFRLCRLCRVENTRRWRKRNSPREAIDAAIREGKKL